MKMTRAGLVLLVVQLLLVLSIAGKYLYERKTRPRVWTRATQFDPSQPLRGRYFALQLLVDGCSLPHDAEHYEKGFKDFKGEVTPGSWAWQVRVDAKDGRLLPVLNDFSNGPRDVYRVIQREDKSCARAVLQTEEEFFVPEHAVLPRVEKTGQELWVEVTVPPSGPPRPIQLAVSDGKDFKPLVF